MVLKNGSLEKFTLQNFNFLYFLKEFFRIQLNNYSIWSFLEMYFFDIIHSSSSIDVFGRGTPCILVLYALTFIQ